MLNFHGSNQEAVIKELIDLFAEIANNAQGLCVIKKLLSICGQPAYEKYQGAIIAKTASSCIDLSHSPYGNYAVQILLESYLPERCVSVIESLMGKLAHLSMIKYSSNVVERCMERALLPMKAKLINEITDSENMPGKYDFTNL